MPIPTEFGAPIDAVVTKIVNNAAIVRVRQLPSTSATIINSLRVGTRLTYRVPKVPYYADGNRWAYSDTHQGWFSLDVLTLEVVTPITERVIVPNVPFVSQRGTGADRRINDCGVACVLMIFRWNLSNHNVLPMPSITVDRMILDTRLAAADVALLPGELVSLMNGYGLRGQVIAPNGFTLQKAKAEVDAKRPSIALVTRRVLEPSENIGGHYVVVIGYTNQGIIYHDPWKSTGESSVSNAVFDQALQNPTTINPPYQGVIIL